MAFTVSLLGVNYSIPEAGETGYGSALTSYLRALATAFPQLSGGLNALTAELDWGGSYGVKSLYLKSRSANIATTGMLRLAAGDGIYWRNQANGADIGLTKDSSDNLLWGGSIIPVSNPSGTINGSAFDTASAASLSIGPVNATSLLLSKAGVLTEIKGSLQVDQAATFNAGASMNSQKITSVLDPTSAQDAATKNYVDTKSPGRHLASMRHSTAEGDGAITLTNGSGGFEKCSFTAGKSKVVGTSISSDTTGKFTINTTGTYRITASMTLYRNGATWVPQMILALDKNATFPAALTLYLPGGQHQFDATASGTPYISCTGEMVLDLNATDTIELYIRGNSTVAQRVMGGFIIERIA